MRLNAIVAGVCMTPFGEHMDSGLKSLGAEAVTAALADAGIGQDELQAAWVGHAAAGLVTGQECIRGQVILRSIGLGRIPVVNVENACASASTALNQAAAMVSAGMYDIVLALGVEKLYHADKKKSFAAFSGAVDVEAMAAIMAGLQQGAAKGGAQKQKQCDSRAARRHQQRGYSRPGGRVGRRAAAPGGAADEAREGRGLDVPSLQRYADWQECVECQVQALASVAPRAKSRVQNGQSL